MLYLSYLFSLVKNVNFLGSLYSFSLTGLSSLKTFLVMNILDILSPYILFCFFSSSYLVESFFISGSSFVCISWRICLNIIIISSEKDSLKIFYWLRVMNEHKNDLELQEIKFQLKSHEQIKRHSLKKQSLSDVHG